MKGKKENNGISRIVKLSIAGLLMLFLYFCINMRLGGHLDKMVLKIKKRGDNKQLIYKHDVKQIIGKELGHKISMTQFRDLDLYTLEKALEADSRISRAELYLDKNNVMTIGIIQNLPIARVEVSGGEDYYLDMEGNKVPIGGDLIRVPVVTGSVDRFMANYRKDIEHNLNYVHTVSKRIYEDDFLSALVSQIHVTEEDDIILIPIVGSDRIALGQAELLEEKIYKLKIYYREGLKEIGLSRFQELNLRYEGQIGGVKRDS